MMCWFIECYDAAARTWRRLPNEFPTSSVAARWMNDRCIAGRVARGVKEVPPADERLIAAAHELGGEG